MRRYSVDLRYAAVLFSRIIRETQKTFVHLKKSLDKFRHFDTIRYDKDGYFLIFGKFGY